MTQENKIKVCRIEEETFKELIEAVKHCTSKDDARPVLRYIRVQATETAVIFSALDGFRCGRAIATRQNPIGADCFTCYILPFAFKPLKGMPTDVVIEYDGNDATVEYMTEYGKQKHTFKQPCEKFPDAMENNWKDWQKHDREIGVSGIYVAQACKALARCEGRYGLLTLTTKDSQTEPIYLRAKGELIQNEQVILPIRLHAEGN